MPLCFHSWTKLCSAPRGIADAHWRNCPQFQMVNVGKEPVPMNVFLSYGERDMLRNKRHTTTTDAPNGFGAEEHPLLSLYVMKSTMPDRRYVGVLSPSCMHVLTTTPPHFPTGTWACSPPTWRSMSRTRPFRMHGASRLGGLAFYACKCSPRRPIHFPTGASRLGGPSLPAVCTRSSQSWPKAPTTRCAAPTPLMTTD